jgi:hypothetical protein
MLFAAVGRGHQLFYGLRGRLRAGQRLAKLASVIPGQTVLGSAAMVADALRSPWPEARMRAEVDEKVDQLVSTTEEMKAETRSLRSEFQRLRAIETGTNAIRDPVEHPWLH